MKTRVISEKNARLQNIANKIKAIKSQIYSTIKTFEHFEYQPGSFELFDSRQLDDEKWQPFSLGQKWGGKNILCWFKIPFEIPALPENRKLAFIIQPGKKFEFISSEGGDMREYELMIFLDGEPLQSVDVRRNEIPLWNRVQPGSSHVLTIEAFSGLEMHQHCFNQAELVFIDEEIEAFYYNSQMLYEAITIPETESPESNHLFHLLEKAFLQVDFLRVSTPDFAASISEANRLLETAVYDRMKSRPYPGVVCVGHSHLDLAWKWQTRHSVRKAARTVANVLRLMELYPDFRFTQSQPQLYKYVQTAYPNLFSKIREKVQTGQWEVTGGMWVEADCNIPGGESLVRQFLFGKRYFQKEFGIDHKVVWMPDTFGFCHTLPQIMQKCGMRYFMTTKLSWNQFTQFPYDTFYWEGPDGSRILAHFITTPDRRGWNDYSVDLNPANVQGCWDNYRQQAQNGEVLLSFGWGDGGGGPTREMQENAKRLNHLPLPNHRQGQAEKFFADLEANLSRADKKLPVWNDELYLQLHRGCYTSQAQIKQNNRKSEVLYHDAELFSAISFLLTGDYPHAALNRGWELILLNQFHDILPGSSIPEVYQDSEQEFEAVQTIGKSCLETALKQICAEKSAKAGESGLAIFNSLSWSRSDLARVRLDLLPQNFSLEDVSGKPVACQIDSEHQELLFISRETPAMGFHTYKVLPQTKPVLAESGLNISPERLENRFFRIQLNGQGLITSIYDKRNKREVIAPGKSANVLQLFEDRPLANDAWDIEFYYNDKCTELTALEKIEVVETGPVRGGVKLVRQFLDSTITQTIYIYDQLARIDFDTKINWRQHQTLLKAAFPVNIQARNATYEIPFGNIERSTQNNTPWEKAQFEVPAQKWADLSEGNYGVSLLNDCKYGYDIKGNTMRLTLLKSAIDPDPQADIGHHAFCYSLFPHAGGWRQANTPGAAYAFNHPLHTRKLDAIPRERNFLFVKCNQENVIIETVKKAEDNDGIIIRLYEIFNQRNEVCLEFGFPISAVKACNLIEEIEESSVEFSGKTLRCSINPGEIRTFIIFFE